MRRKGTRANESEEMHGLGFIRIMYILVDDCKIYLDQILMVAIQHY
jgi:hypothetical protein